VTIVDTTVWIDYLSGTVNPHTDWLDRQLERQRLGLTDLILCEVLQGIRDEPDFRRVRRELSRFALFQTGGEELAVASAQNYRLLRVRGYTIRKTIDCFIATGPADRSSVTGQGPLSTSQRMRVSRSSGGNPMQTQNLIPRHCRVHVARPGIDPAPQRLRLLKALIAQPVRHIQRPYTVMADDDDALLRIELVVGPRRDFAHRHRMSAGKAGGRRLPGLPHIQQERLAFGRQNRLQLLGSDFEV
jgi:predicted nucleic acid-binding protein